AVYPDEARFPLDYRILLDVREFEGTLGKSIWLRAHWSVLSGKDGKAIAVDESAIEQPTSSASYADMVAAQRAAVTTLAQQIAARVTALPAAARTPARRRDGAR